MNYQETGQTCENSGSHSKSVSMMQRFFFFKHSMDTSTYFVIAAWFSLNSEM